MTIALRQTRSDPGYVSDRVYDGVRVRDAETSANDRERARKMLDAIRTRQAKRD